MSTSPPRLRFAPSPTGPLHLGAARTALMNWLYARANGGQLILRIDDTDVARSSSDFEAEILADLAWLGIGWDEGPMHQSQTLVALYGDPHAGHVEANSKEAGIFERLRTDDHLYERDGATYFRVPDRKVGFEDAVRGPIEFPAGALKDFVALRSDDGGPTYNFAAAVDDYGLGITHVLRGEDHISNTPLQIFVIEALGGTPPSYGHLPLLLGEDGQKLSKRHGASPVSSYREQGYLPETVMNYLALVSMSFGEDEVLGVEELIERFSLGSVHRSAARFDSAKLEWLNGQHIRRMPSDSFAVEMERRVGKPLGPVVIEALKTSAATLNSCAEGAKLFTDPPRPDEGAAKALGQDGASEALETLIGLLPEGQVTIDQAKELLVQVREQMASKGVKPAVAMKAIRAALTGTLQGPELYYFLAAKDPKTLKEQVEAAVKAE